MGNCISKTKNTSQIEVSENSKNIKSNSNLDINLHGCAKGAETFGRYPPINFRKVKKSGFRIGAYVDIGFKDFEAGATFGRNSVQEINFSENNHLKLLKSFENESENNSNEKDKIINTLMSKIIKKDGSSSSEIVE